MKKLKILIIMFASFIISSVSANTVFLAGTPYLNETLIAQLRESPGVLVQGVNEYIASLSQGKNTLAQFQKTRLENYTSSLSNASPGSGSLGQPTLPTRSNPEDFAARGFVEIGRDVYQKQDVSARSIEIYFGENAQFTKEMRTINGRQVETWRPL